MERTHLRSLLAGIALIAAAMLWLEVLVFRLCAATVGHLVAYMVAVCGGAAAALGAVVLAPGEARRSPRLEARAATLALLTAALWLTALLTLTWLSHRLGARRAAVSPGLALGLVLPWLLPFGFAGGAMAVAVRCASPRLGTAGFAGALGGAVACLGLPAAMWLGVPRAALAGAFLPAVAAILFAVAARAAGAGVRPFAAPHWTPLVTAPLIVATLLAGDIGVPWLEIRAVRARLAQGAYRVWSTQGVLTVQREQRLWRLHVDGEPAAVLVETRGGRTRPGASALDVAYGLPTGDDWAALVVSPGAGREVRLALDRGASTVAAIERSPNAVNEIMRGRSAELTGGLYTAAAGVQLAIGDGRATLQGLRGPYQRVILAAPEPFALVAPRVLVWSDRLHTREAMTDHLSRVAPGGLLVVRAPLRRFAAIAASARSALGLDPAVAARQMYACSGSKGAAVLVVGTAALGPRERRDLGRHCKKGRLTVWNNIEATLTVGSVPGRGAVAAKPPSAGDGDRPTPAVVATDERPFLEAVPPVRRLGALAWAALAAWTSRDGAAGGPGPSLPSHVVPAASGRRASRGANALGAERRSRDPSLANHPQVATLAMTAVLVAALSLLTLFLALGRALLGARRSQVSARLPVLLCLAAACYGAALAYSQLALVDLCTVVLGHSGFAWLVGIPVGLAGVAGGRLLIDAVPAPTLRRVTSAVTAAVVVAVIGVYALGSMGPTLWALGSVWRWGLMIGVLASAGLLLGAPLAATLRLASRGQPSFVSLGWGAHAAGWALGGAAAQLAARYAGVRQGLLVAAVLTVLATLALMLSRPRTASSSAAPAAPPQARAILDGAASP